MDSLHFGDPFLTKLLNFTSASARSAGSTYTLRYLSYGTQRYQKFFNVDNGKRVLGPFARLSKFAGKRPNRCRRPGGRSCLACRPCQSEEHTSELQSPCNLVCRLLLEK